MPNKVIHAKTVKDLRDELTKIIDAGTGDFQWNGFDDESIYIYPDYMTINPGMTFEISSRKEFDDETRDKP